MPVMLAYVRHTVAMLLHPSSCLQVQKRGPHQELGRAYEGHVRRDLPN